MDLREFWNNKVVKSPTFRPSRITIKPENTDVPDKLNMSLEANKHYFVVRVNEMFLSSRRKWTTTFDPMVFVTSEFLYDGKRVSIPFVVGDSMMKEKNEIPEGMIYSNTTVAGLHPFKGGSLALSLVLSRVPKENYLRKMLSFVEQAAGTYMTEFATVASGYLKIARVIVDGVDAITDSDEVKPLIGVRDEYDAGDTMKPAYYALINQEEKQYTRDQFFVKNNELFFGNSLSSCSRFRADDYILYSIRAYDTRTDLEALPFFADWKALNTEVTNFDHKLKDEERRKVYAKLFGLNNLMRFSPDLTGAQAKLIAEEFKGEIDARVGDLDLLSGKAAAEKKDERAEWEKQFDMINSQLLQ